MSESAVIDVVHLQRKPKPGWFSVERLFEDVRSETIALDKVILFGQELERSKATRILKVQHLLGATGVTQLHLKNL